MLPTPDESAHDRIPAPPGSKIRRTPLGEGVAYLLPGSGVLAIAGPVIAGVVGCVIAGLLTRVVINDPDAAPFIFVAVLWLGVLCCFVTALARMRSDGAVAVTGDTLSIITRELFRNQKRAWSIQNDVLTVAVIPGTDDDEHSTMEFAVLYPEGDSEEFFGNVSDAELSWLAAEIRQLAGLPEPPRNVSRDAIVVSSLQQVMENAVNVMEDELQAARAAFDESSADADDPANRMMLESIAEMEQRVASANTSVLLTDFGLVTFETWEPGRLVQIKREVLDGGHLARASFFSGLGWGFIGLFMGPFVIPIVGFLVGFIAHVYPGDRVRLYLTIVDLFAFGWPLLPWLVFLFPLSMAIVAVRLDAGFARREVTLDWQSGRLTILTQHDEQSRLLSEISEVVVRPVITSGRNKSSVPQARLEVGIAGRRIVLLETDSAETIAGLTEVLNSPIERLMPLAEQLGSALNVDVRTEDAVEDEFDVVGYPRSTRWPLTRRMWRNARARSKIALLCVVVVMLFYFSAAGMRAWKANALPAERVKRGG